MVSHPTVAVIGASGFIGGRLAEWIVINARADLRPVVRSFGGFARLARFNVDVRLADATDPDAVQRCIDGCEVVFHCVVGGHDTIVRSAAAVYEAAARSGVRRMVYLSSAVVHGHNPPPHITDDSALLGGQPFPYNNSKVAAEQRLKELSADGRVETVVLRPAIVYGPRSRWWSAHVAEQLLSGTAYLVEDGRGLCNTIYIDNLVDAMWQAAFAPAAAGQAFLLSDGERVTWRDFYASVAAGVGADMNGVAAVSRAEAQAIALAARRSARWQRIRQSRLPSAVIGTMSEKAKHVARAVLRPAPRSGEPAVASAPAPAIDPEMASLQWCETLLPIGKARSVLGYEPRVPFRQGALRTASWLRFALGID